MIARNVTLVRVIWGLNLVHGYIDVAGFAVLSDNPRVMGLRAIIGAALGVCVVVGFATPLALALLIIQYFSPSPFGFTLGDQVQTIVAWGLIFLGAGRTASVDARLARAPIVGRVIRALYVCAVSPDRAGLARVRWLLIALFWFVAAIASIYHVQDPNWRRAEVLQIMTVSPAWVRQYASMIAFRNAVPWAFDLFCSVALIVQLSWEMLFLPLMYWKWTRPFAVLQGLAFYLVSIFFLPLGYLPGAELCMWLLTFNYTGVIPVPAVTFYSDGHHPRTRRLRRWIERCDFYERVTTTELIQAPERVQEAAAAGGGPVLERKGTLWVGYDAYWALTLRVFPLMLLFPIVALGKVTGLGPRWMRGGPPGEAPNREFPSEQPRAAAPSVPLPVPAFSRRLQNGLMVAMALFLPVHLVIALPPDIGFAWAQPLATSEVSEWYLLFGQRRVDVLNANALFMDESFTILYETDQEGTPIRVVPLTDHTGRRLSFWQNDLFQYTYGMNWQRAPMNTKFDAGAVDSPTAGTHAFLRRVARLDASIQGVTGKRYYESLYFKRTLNRDLGFPAWSDLRPGSSDRVVMGELEVDYAAQQWAFSYNLPPGHGSERERLEATLAHLRERHRSRSDRGRDG